MKLRSYQVKLIPELSLLFRKIIRLHRLNKIKRLFDIQNNFLIFVLSDWGNDLDTTIRKKISKYLVKTENFLIFVKEN